MYVIKDRPNGTYYTGDMRKDRKFGAIDDAKLYRTWQRAADTIEADDYKLTNDREFDFVVMKVTITEVTTAWEHIHIDDLIIPD